MRGSVVRVIASLVLVAAFAGCGASCPPDKPCTAPDGGTFFDCGKTQCHGSQLCVVPGGCGQEPSPSDSTGRCVDLPSTCTSASTCACESVEQGSGGQCCYFAGWRPFHDGVCTFQCL